jgi:hypothetical protein
MMNFNFPFLGSQQSHVIIFFLTENYENFVTSLALNNNQSSFFLSSLMSMHLHMFHTMLTIIVMRNMKNRDKQCRRKVFCVVERKIYDEIMTVKKI